LRRLAAALWHAGLGLGAHVFGEEFVFGELASRRQQPLTHCARTRNAFKGNLVARAHNADGILTVGKDVEAHAAVVVGFLGKSLVILSLDVAALIFSVATGGGN
jgi:hypothetical protein